MDSEDKRPGKDNDRRDTKTKTKTKTKTTTKTTTDKQKTIQDLRVKQDKAKKTRRNTTKTTKYYGSSGKRTARQGES